MSAPVVLAVAFFVSNPTTIAFQDISGLLTGADGGENRWRTFLEDSVPGSIHQAEARFDIDPVVTGAIKVPGQSAAELGTVVMAPLKPEVADTPDEERVNRAEKTGRIMSVAPTAPPKGFSAGSLVERHSQLLQPTIDQENLMAFVKPKIGGKEIQIATEFHKRADPARDSHVPVMLASLVNNERGDSLATAYAPAEPDFARESPFRSLLKDPEDDAQGRFIPPVPESDHAWARTPLPPVVFTDGEQKCLAEGIYFEARGESLKGQAAVGQVILNRVRNPAFPNTICGVVYQNDTWRNRCQFSFACDGKQERINSPKHWAMAKDVAMAVTAGKIWLDEVGSATHYHAVYVRPKWARTMQRKTRIGLHVFYRTYGGGWS